VPNHSSLVVGHTDGRGFERHFEADILLLLIYALFGVVLIPAEASV
jgi:hypothetical protein